MHVHNGVLEALLTAAEVILVLFFLRMAAMWLGQRNPDSPWAKALGVLAM